MKKLMALLLSLVTVLSMTCVAFAGEMPAISNTYPAEYEYFDDGSYIVTTITEEPSLSLTRTTNTKSGSKKATYYSASNVALWNVTVSGKFSYTGSSAVCTSSTVTSESLNSAWKLSNKSSSKSRATASATATYKQYVNGIAKNTTSKTVTLTCSNKGVLA